MRGCRVFLGLHLRLRLGASRRPSIVLIFSSRDKQADKTRRLGGFTALGVLLRMPDAFGPSCCCANVALLTTTTPPQIPIPLLAQSLLSPLAHTVLAALARVTVALQHPLLKDGGLLPPLLASLAQWHLIDDPEQGLGLALTEPLKATLREADGLKRALGQVSILLTTWQWLSVGGVRFILSSDACPGA